MGRGAIAFLTLGLSCAVAILVPAGIGLLVDGWLHTGPLFSLVGLALGVALAVAFAVRTIRRYL